MSKKYIFKKSFINLVLILSIVLSFQMTSITNATFMEQILGNTKALSLANSVTANPPGHMAVHYNPAGLSKLDEGVTISQGFALAKIERTYKFFPDEEYSKNPFRKLDPTLDPLAYSKGHVTNGRIYIPFAGAINLPILTAPVPFGISFKPTCSKWTFANAIYAPFAGGFEHDQDDPARYQGEAVYLQHLILFSPSVSYAYNNQLSFGVSFGLGQSAMGAITDIRAPALIDVLPGREDLVFEKLADMEFDARDDITPSINLGILWEPNDYFSIGAVYQSPIKLNIKGKYRLSYTDDSMEILNTMNKLSNLNALRWWKIGHVNKRYEYGDINITDFQFPERVQIGIMVKPVKELKLMCDFHWANWSTTENYVMNFDQDIQVIMLSKVIGYNGPSNTVIYPKDFDDTWHLSFGLEYDLNKWLTFRFGYEDRQTCAKDNLFDLFTLPDVDMTGVGFGFRLPKGVEFDIGFAYLTYNDYEVENNTSTNLNSLIDGVPIYSPYAGLNYETSFNAYIGSLNIKMPLELALDIAQKQWMMIESLFY